MSKVQMRDEYPKQKKAEKAPKTRNPLNLGGIMGVLQLFVVASISYSSYIVIMGTDGLIPKLLIAPQIAWATVILITKFTK